MTEKYVAAGLCNSELQIKIWKQGHSIDCSKRGMKQVRYWQPGGIEDEVSEFCKFCEERNKP